MALNLEVEDLGEPQIHHLNKRKTSLEPDAMRAEMVVGETSHHKRDAPIMAAFGFYSLRMVLPCRSPTSSPAASTWPSIAAIRSAFVDPAGRSIVVSRA